MAHLYRVTIFILFFGLGFPAVVLAEAAPVGAVDLAGWIKGADGTYSKAFTNADGTASRVSLTSAPKGITATSTALVQTSKGLQSFDIEKTSSVDMTRLGGAVAKFAKRVGPVGMTVTAASLVCELTNICNDAGKWLFGEHITEVSTLTCATVGTGTVTYKSGGFYNKYKLQPKFNCGGTIPSGWAIVASCSPSVMGCVWGDDMIKELAGSPATQASEPHEATQADFDSKAPALSDSRFIPELLEKSESVPTDAVPTLTPGQKKGLGLDSVPTKDSNGNVTGREDTMTEIEPVDAGTSDNPGRVIIKETKTTIKYDTNNTQISSTTNTSYTNQPNPQQPSGFTISFDTVPEATLPTYNVPNTFGSTSWGSGSCPPNIDVPLLHMTMHIPTQPVCDTAVMINPFVLLISTLIGIYIIAGVRGGSTT